MKINNYLLFLFLFSFLSYQAAAQQLTTNEFGQKIVVFSDGSWRYAEDEDLKAYEKKPVAPASEKMDVEDPSLIFAIQIAEAAAAEEAEAIKAEEEAQYDRILIEDELRDAEESDDYFDDEIKEIKTRLKAAKKFEKKAKSARKEISKNARNIESLVTMAPKDREKALRKNDAYSKFKANSSIASNTEGVGMFPGELPQAKIIEMPDPPQKEEVVIANLVEVKEQSGKPNAAFAKYDPKNDVSQNPPPYKCELAFDGVDEFSGKKRKDVQKELFFTYTNDELRSVFKERDYMECTGYLSALSGGLTFLTLNITINSKTAQREYGILEKGGLINIKLLNGENIKLVNSKTNIGTENPLENSVSYRAQYIISSGDEKKLKKSEVDKIRIIWSSGYEDYEIYELDFFMNQFKCLGK